MSQAFLDREGEQNAPREIIRQLRRSPSISSSNSDVQSPPQSPTHIRSPSDEDGSSRRKKLKQPPKLAPVKPPAGWKEPQPFEVFRAVENKDIMFL